MVAKKYFTSEELKKARNEHTKNYRKRNPEIIKKIRNKTDQKFTDSIFILYKAIDYLRNTNV